MAGIIKITQAQLAADPHAVWNGFVHFLAYAEPEKLTPVQQAAYFAFWYESEVCNGGHYQYFQNRGTGDIDAVIAGLKLLKMMPFADLAEQARARVRSHPPVMVRTLEEFSAGALEGEFNDLDTAFYQCAPTITDMLEDYLRDHETDFAERVS